MKKVTKRDILALVSFYLFFSFVYHAVLWYISNKENSIDYSELFSFSSYWYMAGMQYAFYFVASIIIWFFAIRLMTNKAIAWQIIIVALLIPIVAFFVRELRYELLDTMGKWHLNGKAAIWDWYIPCLFLLIQFGCFFAYRYFLENQRKLRVEGELRQAALKSELAAIKAQLNPHFLYNVFNTINASVPAKQEKTRQLIATLADLFRYQLRASKKEYVPLSEEMEFVNKYLELEKARFEERLEIEINVPKELHSEKIPPMLLQPLVENSVKHGISSSLSGGKVSITIFKENEKLKFEIADTGKGVKDKKNLFGKGVGLSNTQLRLQKMYQTQLEFLDNEPQGLKIRFAI